MGSREASCALTASSHSASPPPPSPSLSPSPSAMRSLVQGALCSGCAFLSLSPSLPSSFLSALPPLSFLTLLSYSESPSSKLVQHLTLFFFLSSWSLSWSLILQPSGFSDFLLSRGSHLSHSYSNKFFPSLSLITFWRWLEWVKEWVFSLSIERCVSWYLPGGTWKKHPKCLFLGITMVINCYWEVC